MVIVDVVGSIAHNITVYPKLIDIERRSIRIKQILFIFYQTAATMILRETRGALPTMALLFLWMTFSAVFPSHAFTIRPLAPTVKSCSIATTSSTQLGPLQQFLESMTVHGEKYFQLEEKEDAETCTTELRVLSDYTVVIGETNGPLPAEASGSWTEVTPEMTLENDGVFEMILTRTYETGREAQESTDMDKFSFTTTRKFVGDFTFVGASVNVAGTIVDVDPVFGDRQVGYFSMIDVTQEREEWMQENSNSDDGAPPPPYLNGGTMVS